jgi:hypothetical protein
VEESLVDVTGGEGFSFANFLKVAGDVGDAAVRAKLQLAQLQKNSVTDNSPGQSGQRDVNAKASGMPSWLIPAAIAGGLVILMLLVRR